MIQPQLIETQKCRLTTRSKLSILSHKMYGRQLHVGLTHCVCPVSFYLFFPFFILFHNIAIMPPSTSAKPLSIYE